MTYNVFGGTLNLAQLWKINTITSPLKYYDEYVLFVCLLAYLRKHTTELHQIFEDVACSRDSVSL